MYTSGFYERLAIGLGVVQLIGGVHGLFLVLATGFGGSVFQGTVILLGLVYFSLSAVAGVLLWTGKDCGLILSMVVWGVQFLAVASPILMLEVYAGVRVTPYLRFAEEGSSIHLAVNLGSHMTLGVAREYFAIGVNLAAVCAFVALDCLWRARDRNRQHEERLAEAVEQMTRE
ncbi:MAG: hypothetical protein AAF809_06990 [Bacteroidota bacterium]